MKLLILGAATLTLLCALDARAQPIPPTLAETLTDAQNISLVSYGLSQIADSTTDWKFTLAGKTYNVNPTQRVAFAGATTFGAIAVAHYMPRAKPYVTAALVIGTAILAGRAYAHTLTRGAPPIAGAVTPAAGGLTASFRIR